MEKKLKIIVVEDSENDTLLEVRLIERAGYKVKHVRVETKEELEAALKSDEWDVVLSDFTMPHFSGAEALKVVRSRDDFIPFIFVSGTIGEDRAVKTLKDGASDYILKIDPKRLVSSIERELRDKGLRLQRIKAQDELRESEERYRDLFDSAPVGYHEIDAGGIITRVNRMELKLFGYERDEMVGRPAWLFVADPEASKERVAAKLAGRINISEHFDRVYVRKDGSTFPATIEESYIRDKMGIIVGIRTVVEDVTEKRLIEERLRLATLVIENSSSILFRCLPEMGWPISYLSDNVTDWGYDHSALSSGAFPFSDLIAQADMDRVQQEVERSMFEHRDRFSIDFRVLKPDASAIWVSAHCTVMRDRIGNVTYYQGVLTDINERKKAEESLKLFRELIDQSYDAIEVVDPETGRFVDGNEALWSSLGYTREEFFALTFSDVH
ncbi:MAG TPA: PAS domain S-box protein, partial [Candidatus Kryptobacter bacterium]|nr:PAS domain S-box protein [Candidatus Kryptobacter bacterium]